ncbi:hypothetical protein EDB85DRAFT_2281018 [Lactarius pseudohatsudake]|nr:hypothetical protein EDB85DRAFT_2281018 [Lactarius pseudohatsudake]
MSVRIVGDECLSDGSGDVGGNSYDDYMGIVISLSSWPVGFGGNKYVLQFADGQDPPKTGVSSQRQKAGQQPQVEGGKTHWRPATCTPEATVEDRNKLARLKGRRLGRSGRCSERGTRGSRPTGRRGSRGKWGKWRCPGCRALKVTQQAAGCNIIVAVARRGTNAGDIEAWKRAAVWMVGNWSGRLGKVVVLVPNASDMDADVCRVTDLCHGRTGFAS